MSFVRWGVPDGGLGERVHLDDHLIRFVDVADPDQVAPAAIWETSSLLLLASEMTFCVTDRLGK